MPIHHKVKTFIASRPVKGHIAKRAKPGGGNEKFA
jgi:hypothetical protein